MSMEWAVRGSCSDEREEEMEERVMVASSAAYCATDRDLVMKDCQVGEAG